MAGAAAIRYALNGAEPADSDPEVPAGGVVHISSPSQLRARAFVSGRAPSATARANYAPAATGADHRSIERQLPDDADGDDLGLGTLVGRSLHA